MNITYKNAVKSTKKFQQGGPVSAPAEDAEESVQQEPVTQEAPPEEETQMNPMMELIQIFIQGLQNQDCQMLAQGAQMFLQLAQQAAGEIAPTAEPQGEPVFAKKGAKLLYRIKK